MAMVHYVTTQEADASIRPHFERLEGRGHEVPNFLRTLAHSPQILEGFIALNGAMGKGTLDPKLRELAYIRASEVNSCGYCLDHHKKAGLKAGLTERQVNETEGYAGSEIYDELQQDAIAYAEEVTRNVILDDDLAVRLKTKLSERDFLELAVTVALANFTNRISETLRLELP
jgi:AhpD family alkylhydroperoxidase